jgi:hypothetical protein
LIVLAPPGEFDLRMRLQHLTTSLGCIGLLLLAVAYCLPQHPSANHAVTLDVLAHIALFTGIGLWFGWFGGHGVRVFIPLLAVAALLEVLQWWIGGYPRIEVADILANAAGLGLAWALLQRRHMKTPPPAGHEDDDKEPPAS